MGSRNDWQSRLVITMYHTKYTHGNQFSGFQFISQRMP